MVNSGKVTLFQINQVRSGYYLLGQIRTGYARLFQVVRLDHVVSGYSGYFRLCHGSSGQFCYTTICQDFTC